MIERIRFYFRLRTRLRTYLRERQLQSIPDGSWFKDNLMGFKWRLNLKQLVDYSIAKWGNFELETTALVQHFLRPGMKVLDVGANIGYFSLISARAIGESGHLWSFEPVVKYREQLTWHLEHNNLDEQVTILDYGLSDKPSERNMQLFDSSASFYQGYFPDKPTEETVALKRLDDVATILGLSAIDFVKVDIDGHECAFIEGATQTLSTHKPVILIEVAHIFLEEAGCSASGLKIKLENMGYTLFSEKTELPFENLTDFLMEATYHSHSINVWCIPDYLVTNTKSSLRDLLDTYSSAQVGS